MQDWAPFSLLQTPLPGVEQLPPSHPEAPGQSHCSAKCGVCVEMNNTEEKQALGDPWRDEELEDSKQREAGRGRTLGWEVGIVFCPLNSGWAPQGWLG